MNTKKLIVFVISLIIAVAGTLLYISAKRDGIPTPNYVLGMLAYGWIFVGYMVIDSGARAIKNNLRGK